MEGYKDHNFNEGEKGGCLKLLQFTERSNVSFLEGCGNFNSIPIQISPSFFIGTNSYTVLPSYDKKNTTRDAVRRLFSCLSDEVRSDRRSSYTGINWIPAIRNFCANPFSAPKGISKFFL